MIKVQIQKYSTHKPSVIQWLGNIPDTWAINRVKDNSRTVERTAKTLTNGVVTGKIKITTNED